jgi:helix-turn-helix protein
MLVLRDDDLLLFAEAEDEPLFRLPLQDLTDLSTGYVPRAYEERFEDAIALSWAGDGDGGVVLLAPQGVSDRRFLVALLSQVVDGVRAVVVHPTRRGEQETDEEPAVERLYAHPYELEFGGSDERGTGTVIRFSSIIHVEEERIVYDNSRVPGLAIRYLRTIGPNLTTQLRPIDSDRYALLQRVVTWEYNRRVREVKQLTLTPEEKEVLRALYDASSGRDRALTATLDRSSQELTALLGRLKRKELIRQDTNRATLSRTGHMLFTLEKV